MRFNDQVTLGYSVEGPKWVSPAKFETMTDEWKYYYVAKYADYRKVKVREYSICDECGHREFLGWVEEEKPIGKPIRFVKIQQFIPYPVYKAGMESMLESVNHSNVLARRILNDKNT